MPCRRLVVLAAFASTIACFSPERLDGDVVPTSSDGGEPTAGDDAASASGATSMTGVPGSDSGGDSGCVDDGQCMDENPCSDDRCDAGTCVHTPITDDPSCACVGPGDCEQLPPDDECRVRTCEGGVCGQQLTDASTPLGEAAQAAEDCQVVVCDGRGGTETIEDPSDVPDDGLECTEDACVGGVPTSTPVDAGIECSAGHCNDAGQCAGCASPAECAGVSDFCQAVTCVDSVCGVTLTDADTPLPDGDQTTGDCLRRVCDGKGNVASVADDDDLPDDDGSECTDETCTNGVEAHPPLSADAECAGGVCDGDGSCVECNTDDQCPAAGACTVGVCQDGVCGVGFADGGTPCNDGLFCTSSDACDGTGSCVGSGNPCPGADGDSDCSETCNEGADACTGNDGAGSACNDGLFCTSSDTCNGAGTCVGAGNPCPGADGDSDCSETCNEVLDNCSGNDLGGSDCGACRTCSNGTCQSSDCSVGEKCCAADDICIPTQAQCP